MRIPSTTPLAALALAFALPLAATPAAAHQCPETGLTPGNYAAYVKRIQEELPQHGYRAGAPSGQLDPRTVEGIRRYQRDAGLPRDGCVTVALMDHMLYAQPKVYASIRAEDTALEREVQQALAQRGYYTGAIDGIVGPKTIAALEAFQLDAGLRVNPTVSRSTLAAIREADPAIRAP